MKFAVAALVFSTVLSAPAHALNLPLGLTRDLPAGAGPSGVVAADFNGDGNADFAVIERDVDSLSVWFGDGTGNFAGRTRYPTGDFPRAIAAGDLNGDGRVELAIANGVSNTVTVYRGLTLGAFGNRIDYPVGLSPTGLVIGDANSDTRPDVIVANSLSNTVTILLGTGIGGTPLTLQTGTGCRAVAVGDIDWDGVTDLVTANTTADSISIFMGLPGGGFEPRLDRAVADQPVALGLTDLNQDGRLDLAVLSAIGYLSPFFNVNGDLVPGPLSSAGNNPSALAITDIELPGQPDLVIGSSTSSTLSYLRGGTGSPFQILGSGSGVLGVAAADFDGDGFRDVVVTTLAPPAVSVLMSFGYGPFSGRGMPVGTNPSAVAIADLNGDSRPDFAVTNSGSASITTYLNDGTGTFAGRVDVPAPPGPSAIAAADFNGDSKPDLALSTFRAIFPDTSRVSVFLNQGSGVFNARTDYDMASGQPRIGLAVGDVTHDGTLDLVTGHQNTTVVQVLSGNGLGAFTTGPALTTYNSPTAIDLADVDGNGSLDAFVGGAASFGEGRVCAFLANGAGGFAPKVDYLVGSYPAAIVHGDFDEDGKVDLAVGNQASGDIWILRGNGLGGLTYGATVTLPGAQLYALATADINSDGDLDLIAGRAGELGIVYGRGDGTFSRFAASSFTSNNQTGLAAADLNADSVPDLVVVHSETATASVLLGKRKSRTTLTVSPNPSAAGQSLTLQATTTPAAGGTGTPAGTVRFFDGTSLIGSADLVNGVATLVLAGDYPWDREFSAAYLSGFFFGSISPTVPHFTYVPNVGVPPVGTRGTLALAPIGNPARAGGGLKVRVALDGPEPARLTVHDVRGRVLASREVTGTGIAELSPARRLAPGVYLVRLEQGAAQVTARTVVL